METTFPHIPSSIAIVHRPYNLDDRIQNTLHRFHYRNIDGYVGFHRRLANLRDIEIANLFTSWFDVTLPMARLAKFTWMSVDV